MNRAKGDSHEQLLPKIKRATSKKKHLPTPPKIKKKKKRNFRENSTSHTARNKHTNNQHKNIHSKCNTAPAQEPSKNTNLKKKNTKHCEQMIIPKTLQPKPASR